jgi:hypothetical protein
VARIERKRVHSRVSLAIGILSLQPGLEQTSELGRGVDVRPCVRILGAL